MLIPENTSGIQTLILEAENCLNLTITISCDVTGLSQLFMTLDFVMSENVTSATKGSIGCATKCQELFNSRR